MDFNNKKENLVKDCYIMWLVDYWNFPILDPSKMHDQDSLEDLKTRLFLDMDPFKQAAYLINHAFTTAFKYQATHSEIFLYVNTSRDENLHTTNWHNLSTQMI